MSRTLANRERAVECNRRRGFVGGTMACTLQSETGPIFAWGYWSAIYVREGDAWKIRMLSLVEHPVPRFETK